ncbi:MAG: CAAD domain-containing protein, partial [Cyanobium sp.]
VGEVVMSYGDSDGPGDLDAVLAAALDEDDLPDPHPPAPTPTLEAATARPNVGSSAPAERPTEPTPSGGAPGEPTVATTLEVPPLAKEAGGEGGEFDLLIRKLTAWFEQADLGGQWDRLGGPLRGLGILLGGLLVIKFYLALLDPLDDVPLLPRMLQLLGLIWLFNFSVTRLTRTTDRKEILEAWKRRWDAFRGT